MVISPDGTRLATAGQDGISRIYLLKIVELVKLAHSRLTHSLTAEECQNICMCKNAPLYHDTR